MGWGDYIVRMDFIKVSIVNYFKGWNFIYIINDKYILVDLIIFYIIFYWH